MTIYRQIIIFAKVKNASFLVKNEPLYVIAVQNDIYVSTANNKENL